MTVGTASGLMRSTVGHSTVLGEGVAGEMHGWARTFVKLKSLLQPSSSFNRRRGDLAKGAGISASIIFTCVGYGSLLGFGSTRLGMFEVATELRGEDTWARRKHWTRGKKGWIVGDDRGK